MACRLLEEVGWTRCSMARDARGAACDLGGEPADSYCLSGVLVKSWRELDRANEDLYFSFFEVRFSEIILAKYNYRCTLTRWNDEFAADRDEVIELIHAVISSLRSQTTPAVRQSEACADSGPPEGKSRARIVSHSVLGTRRRRRRGNPWPAEDFGAFSVAFGSVERSTF